METLMESFEFKDCTGILKSTGKKAKNIRELRNVISEVSGDSIFHHTYQYFLKALSFEYTNDFAHWVGESIEERALAEQLSNIDPYDYSDINDLRTELISVIDQYLARYPEPREARTGDEFYFNETVTLVFPVGIRVKNLAEFLIAMEIIDTGSIYYHYFEARLRLRDGVDDFSRWIEGTLGKVHAAEKIRSIDPFMYRLDGIRKHIIEVVEDEVKKDMEILWGQG